MRDPDLVVRAQRAATALESAWCRWRNMHGLTADPPAPVSSYVGYSLDAPWGQPRVVLGLCAEEAEALAVLLDRHDCVGPVHASVTAKPVGQAPDDPADAPDAAPSPVGQIPGGKVPAGLLRVPQPAPASAGQQPLPASSGFSRPDSRPGPAAPRRRDTGPSPLTSASVPDYPDLQTPIALAASRAVEASVASRKKSVNGSAGPRAERPGGAATAESAAASDDHPDPGSGSGAGRDHGPQPAAGLTAGSGQATPGQSHGNGSSHGNGAASSAAAAAAAAVGGLPTVPVAVQPFMWAGGLARSTAPSAPSATEQPAARAAGQADQDGGPARDDYSGAGMHPAGGPAAGPEGSGSQRSEGQRSGRQQAPSRDAGQNGSGIVAFRPRPAEPGADPGRAPGSAPHPGDSAADHGSAAAGRDAAGPDGTAGQPGAAQQPGQGSWSPGASGPWNGPPGHGGPGQGGPGHDAPGHGGSYPAAGYQQPADPAGRESGSREATGVRHPAGDPSRPNRVLRSGTLARLKRAGQACEVTQPGSASARPAAPAGDGRARVAPPASAEAATWVSGELPGQAAVTDTAL
jgi:hypothetical protein